MEGVEKKSSIKMMTVPINVEYEESPHSFEELTQLAEKKAKELHSLQDARMHRLEQVILLETSWTLVMKIFKTLLVLGIGGKKA